MRVNHALGGGGGGFLLAYSKIEPTIIKNTENARDTTCKGRGKSLIIVVVPL
jgi:hypothetical protein